MLAIITAAIVPIIILTFWWESSSTNCAFGGSLVGRDNWLISRIKRRVQIYRMRAKTRRARHDPREVFDM